MFLARVQSKLEHLGSLAVRDVEVELVDLARLVLRLNETEPGIAGEVATSMGFASPARFEVTSVSGGVVVFEFSLKGWKLRDFGWDEAVAQDYLERWAMTWSRLTDAAVALESFREITGAYPAEGPGLPALVNAGHLTADQLVDGWGGPLNHRLEANGRWGVQVYSLGADGTPGGDGPSADITFP